MATKGNRLNIRIHPEKRTSDKESARHVRHRLDKVRISEYRAEMRNYG